MLRAYAADNYGQWVTTNFLAVPVLMTAAMLLVVTTGFIAANIRRGGGLNSPEIAGMLALLLALDALVGWGVWATVKVASVPHLLTWSNALWILLPTLFVAMLMRSIWQMAGHCKSIGLQKP